MTNRDNKQRIYLKALRGLRQLIDKDYKNGGKLPSERIMCQELGISRMTYRKVLGWLIRENLIKSYPSRGHWVVPDYQRCNKIGIVLQSGKESPFLAGRNMIGICSNLVEHRYFSQLIQASPIDNIGFAAVTHAVHGLIWIMPTPEEIECLKNVHDNEGLPVLAVTGLLSDFGGSIENVPYIGWDMESALLHTAEYFKKRGHERVVYISHDNEDICRMFAEAFKSVGLPFDLDQIIVEGENIGERMCALRKKYNADAVFTEGITDMIEELLGYCSTLSQSEQPGIVLPDTYWLPKMLTRYPHVKVIGVRQGNFDELSGKVVKAMVDHLETGSPMQSGTVQNFFIRDYTVK